MARSRSDQQLSFDVTPARPPKPGRVGTRLYRYIVAFRRAGFSVHREGDHFVLDGRRLSAADLKLLGRSLDAPSSRQNPVVD